MAEAAQGTPSNQCFHFLCHLIENLRVFTQVAYLKQQQIPTDCQILSSLFTCFIVLPPATTCWAKRTIRQSSRVELSSKILPKRAPALGSVCDFPGCWWMILMFSSQFPMGCVCIYIYSRIYLLCSKRVCHIYVIYNTTQTQHTQPYQFSSCSFRPTIFRASTDGESPGVG